MSRNKKATAGNPKIAIAYLRVSTDRQDLSPVAQRDSIEAWARTHGVQVVSWHLDKGVSGTSSLEDRPELIAALACIKAHGAGLLLVAKRDRLARDTLVAQLVEQAASKVGAVVVSADGIANGEDAADRLLRGILDHVAAYEVAAIRARIRAALRVKKARGERVGGLPYGFCVDGKRLVQVDHEQEVIELVRALRAEGMTYRGVAEALEGLGHVSRNGKRFHPQQVQRMMAAA